MAASFGAVILGVLLEQAPVRLYAALGAVLVIGALATLIGGFTALIAAGSYADDESWVRSHLGTALAYLRRASAYGLALAGIGALLTTALPAKVLADLALGDRETPTSGLVALFFGSVGVGVGLLEEWRSRGFGAPTPDASDGHDGDGRAEA